MPSANVEDADGLRTGQIGDGAGKAEHPIIGAGREAEAADPYFSRSCAPTSSLQ
jgi:hypothetical protein